MKMFIVIKLTFEGVHRWQDCQHMDVMYLRNPHRHVFHVRAVKKITHEERDIEFIRYKRQIGEWIHQQILHEWDLLEMSCESIAARILDAFLLEECEVLEDGENGALVRS